MKLDSSAIEFSLQIVEGDSSDSKKSASIEAVALEIKGLFAIVHNMAAFRNYEIVWKIRYIDFTQKIDNLYIRLMINR